MTQFEAQLQRIREKLPLAKQKDSKLEVFGARSHQYQFGSPLSEADVRDFEQQHSLQLPEDYRAFITTIGHGGNHSRYGAAGPHYGLYALAQTIRDKDYLSEPCLLYPNISPEDWQKHLEFLEQDDIADEDYDHYSNTLFQGLVEIGTQGCTYQTCLVLTGEHRSRVVYIDDEFIRTPFFPHEANFLEWYERWLDEVIHGYDVTDFGYFMGGDEVALIQKFQQSSDTNLQASALSSLKKLPVIQPETVAFIEAQLRHANKQICLSAFRLLTNYAYNKAKPAIKTYLHSSDPDEQLMAVKSIFWYAKTHSSEWVTDIAALLPSVNDEVLFDFIGYVLKESQQDYGELLAPFLHHSNRNIRKQAAYLIGLLATKSTFVDALIPLLQEEDAHLQVTTLQALSGIRDLKLLPYYKNILQQYQTNDYSVNYILSHVLHRLNDLGEHAREVLKETLEHPNEEARAQAQKILAELKPTSSILGWFKKSQ